MTNGTNNQTPTFQDYKQRFEIFGLMGSGTQAEVNPVRLIQTNVPEGTTGKYVLSGWILVTPRSFATLEEVGDHWATIGDQLKANYNENPDLYNNLLAHPNLSEANRNILLDLITGDNGNGANGNGANRNGANGTGVNIVSPTGQPIFFPVRDAQGNVIPGISIYATNPGSVTTGEGWRVFQQNGASNIAPGLYSLGQLKERFGLYPVLPGGPATFEPGTPVTELLEYGQEKALRLSEDNQLITVDNAGNIEYFDDGAARWTPGEMRVGSDLHAELAGSGLGQTVFQRQGDGTWVKMEREEPLSLDQQIASFMLEDDTDAAAKLWAFQNQLTPFQKQQLDLQAQSIGQDAIRLAIDISSSPADFFHLMQLSAGAAPIQQQGYEGAFRNIGPRGSLAVTDLFEGLGLIPPYQQAAPAQQTVSTEAMKQDDVVRDSIRPPTSKELATRMDRYKEAQNRAYQEWLSKPIQKTDFDIKDIVALDKVLTQQAPKPKDFGMADIAALDTVLTQQAKKQAADKYAETFDTGKPFGDETLTLFEQLGIEPPPSSPVLGSGLTAQEMALNKAMIDKANLEFQLKNQGEAVKQFTGSDASINDLLALEQTLAQNKEKAQDIDYDAIFGDQETLDPSKVLQTATAKAMAAAGDYAGYAGGKPALSQGAELFDLGYLRDEYQIPQQPVTIDQGAVGGKSTADYAKASLDHLGAMADKGYTWGSQNGKDAFQSYLEQEKIKADLGLGVYSNSQGMAGGGIVQGPTLATLGETGPEMVIPLDPRKRQQANRLVNMYQRLTANDIPSFANGGVVKSWSTPVTSAVGQYGKALSGTTMSPQQLQMFKKAAGTTKQATMPPAIDSIPKNTGVGLTPETFLKQKAPSVYNVGALGQAIPKPKQLSPLAGITMPSMQAWRRFTPIERETFLAAVEATGIPRDMFLRESGIDRFQEGGISRRRPVSFQQQSLGSRIYT